MKRLLFLSGILLLLSGCGLWQKDNGISYDDLRSQFVAQNFSSPLFSTTFASTGQGFRERLQLQVEWSDDIMSVKLLLRGQKDFSLSGAMGSYFYDVDFLDKAENLPVRWSGDVLYIAKDGKEYLRTNTTKIDLGTGNAEGIMVQLIVDALSKKWLYMDKPDFVQTWMFALPLHSYFYLLPLGVKDIFETNFLAPWSQETTAYSVNGSYDVRNQFMPFLASSGFAFDWTLWSDKDVDSFDLERFVFGDLKGIGTLAGGKGNLVLQSGDSQYTILREDAPYGAINVTLTYTLASVKQWWISGTLRQKTMSDGGLLWAAKGTISLLTSPASAHYISLNFQGNYALNPQQNIDVRVPNNVLLISQFFGDEFGLGALLDQ